MRPTERESLPPKVVFNQDGPMDGPSNMAADLQLLQVAEQGRSGCRVYTWDGPWVSLGRFQKPEEALKPGYEKYVVRPTGGKAVLHGHDQTVGLAVPFEGRSVKKAYGLVLGPILDALADCGLSVETAGQEKERRLGVPDCFASTSVYDVVLAGTYRKVAGAAMRIGNGALLLQVSIPYRSPLVKPDSAVVGARSEAILDWDWLRFGEALRLRCVSEL